MFRSKTVFVLGAGASEEVGLPIGEKLKTKIAHKIDFKVEYGQLKNSGDSQIIYATAFGIYLAFLHWVLLSFIVGTFSFRSKNTNKKNQQFRGFYWTMSVASGVVFTSGLLKNLAFLDDFGRSCPVNWRPYGIHKKRP